MTTLVELFNENEHLKHLLFKYSKMMDTFVRCSIYADYNCEQTSFKCTFSNQLLEQSQISLFELIKMQTQAEMIDKWGEIR
jgi:hypothetical protein